MTCQRPHAARVVFAALALLAVGLVAGCDRSGPIQDAISPHSVGNAHHGAELVQYFGCGGCHTIPGIANADGIVGPPLTGMARRIYIAGMLRNTPDNMEQWIRNPQSVVPGNTMPAMGIDPHDARDIAAYLYTLR